MKKIAAALGLALSFALASQAAGPPAALDGPRKAVLDADYRAVGHLVRVDPNGKRTNEDITIKAHSFSGVLRVLVDITAPADARARILLEMRPNGQSSIRIAHPGDKTLAVIPFDKWSDGPVDRASATRIFFSRSFSGQARAFRKVSAGGPTIATC